MTTDLPSWLPVAGGIAAAVGAVGGLAGLSTLLNARATKRKTNAEAEKTDADAAEKLTDVALKLVEPLSHELATLRAAHASTQTRVGQLESDARMQHMLLVEHSVWDHVALARLRDHGVDMPTIPPLFPPSPPQPTATVTTMTVTTSGEPAT